MPNSHPPVGSQSVFIRTLSADTNVVKKKERVASFMSRWSDILESQRSWRIQDVRVPSELGVPERIKLYRHRVWKLSVQLFV